jgi:hypothetical protein
MKRLQVFRLLFFGTFMEQEGYFEVLINAKAK